jgi:bacteriophage N4 adsorption protein B
MDAFVAACLVPIGIAILLSGLDDLALDAVCLWAWIKNRLGKSRQLRIELDGSRPEKQIAIFVPLWHEHAVIGGMVEHNVAAINYDNYHFFIGAYPNDEPTLDAVRDLETRFPHVHLAVCPHDGPTSKADCLNWIYQRMLLFEEKHGQPFDVVVTHDAEDLIHPQALATINAYSDSYDMVQIPVLPLPTPFPSIVHSIYCDEFSEWQIKDMPARQLMGSFIPSNGVGTGITRAALEKLASAEHNLIFEPSCLTEDYEIGLRLHQLGCAQIFVPLAGSRAGIVATREFFPQTTHSAIRQRTRWTTGIGLQCWERHGWRGTWSEIYWFWRDRKGLFGNPLSLITNFLFLYGLASWSAAHLSGTPWTLAKHTLYPWVLFSTLLIWILQTIIRIACALRLYGAFFALGVPLRALFANWINSVAALKAVFLYTRARLRHEPLVWLKTEHAYPSRSALVEHKRKLGEVLAGSGYASEADVLHALATQPAGTRLGEYLVKLGKITEEDLYEALSLQHSLPVGRLEPWGVSRNAARSLPRHVVRNWHVLPFRIASGNLFLASPEIPSDDLSRTLRGFTSLTLRFHLVTPGNFEELTRQLL